MFKYGVRCCAVALTKFVQCLNSSFVSECFVCVLFQSVYARCIQNDVKLNVRSMYVDVLIEDVGRSFAGGT